MTRGTTPKRSAKSCGKLRWKFLNIKKSWKLVKDSWSQGGASSNRWSTSEGSCKRRLSAMTQIRSPIATRLHHRDVKSTQANENRRNSNDHRHPIVIDTSVQNVPDHYHHWNPGKKPTNFTKTISHVCSSPADTAVDVLEVYPCHHQDRIHRKSVLVLHHPRNILTNPQNTNIKLCFLMLLIK